MSALYSVRFILGFLSVCDAWLSENRISLVSGDFAITATPSQMIFTAVKLMMVFYHWLVSIIMSVSLGNG